MRISLKSSLGLTAALTMATLLASSALLFWQRRDTTVYAKQFSEERFRQVKPGMEIQEVYALLGQPLSFRPENSSERWCYGEAEAHRKGNVYVVENFLSVPHCILFDENGMVDGVTGDKLSRLTKGMTQQEVLGLLGQPSSRQPAISMTLHYTLPGGDGLFRWRTVAVDSHKRVNKIIIDEFYD
ncbi:MAG TPA: hypothetical protein VEG34_06570 [Thermoanaerobaculia bacterium]|nr:hypothetical protein [Thermoanaerobaculia bacterium]